MTRKKLRRYQRLMVLLAAAPLFQLMACRTGVSETLQNVLNALPATVFQVTESLFLSPLYALLSGGSTSSTTTGTTSGGTGI